MYAPFQSQYHAIFGSEEAADCSLVASRIEFRSVIYVCVLPWAHATRSRLCPFAYAIPIPNLHSSCLPVRSMSFHQSKVRKLLIRQKNIHLICLKTIALKYVWFACDMSCIRNKRACVCEGSMLLHENIRQQIIRLQTSMRKHFREEY